MQKFHKEKFLRRLVYSAENLRYLIITFIDIVSYILIISRATYNRADSYLVGLY